MSHTTAHHYRQEGISLVIVMMILVITSILGISAFQLTTLGERSARNDRDTQMAWQSAESVVVDAEYDIRHSPLAGGQSRSDMLGGFGATDKIDPNNFVLGCGTTGKKQGLCALPTDTSSKPAWLSVDFSNMSTTAPTVAFGTFTGLTFASGTLGPQPARPPRYIIEILPDTGNRDRAVVSGDYVFRVTGMGYGPRDDIQSVVQTIYRN